MISRLEILLSEDQELSYQMGTVFHGALMELLPEEVTEELHSSQVHPYSQYIVKKEGRWYWVVTALNEKLAKDMIYSSLLSAQGIFLKNNDINIKFEEKKLTETSLEAMSKKFYSQNSGKYVDLDFLTPTSFKQQGKYLFYPDIRGMYISLLNKYGACDPGVNVRDEDLLEELVNSTQITRYRLRSCAFYVDNGRVPSFIGSISLKINGTQTMRNFADFLFHFGEFSGIGIKSALGMGANRINLEREQTK